MITPEIITTGIFTIIGAITGGLIGYYTSISVNRAVIRNDAANNLRSAFLPFITKIKTDGFASESDLRNAVVSSFFAHAIEIERFRYFVPCVDRTKYDKAYDEYKHMISLRPLNIGSEIHVEEFYLKKVDAILHFSLPY